MQEYIAKTATVLEAIKKDPAAHHRLPNRDMLLLDDALAMVDAATGHLVLPYDCRSIDVAKRNLDQCEQRGRCAGRCQFKALHRKDGRVVFTPQKCWGCGLCATGCPCNAIAMAPLRR